MTYYDPDSVGVYSMISMCLGVTRAVELVREWHACHEGFTREDYTLREFVRDYRPEVWQQLLPHLTKRKLLGESNEAE